MVTATSVKYKAVFHTLSCTCWPIVRLWKCSVGWVVRSGLKLMKVQGLHNFSTDKTLITILMISGCKFVHVSDLFSLRSWHRKLHIWSPNYTSMLALHKLGKWHRFGCTVATSMICFSCFEAVLIFTWLPCSKGTCAHLWYACIRSCNCQ